MRLLSYRSGGLVTRRCTLRAATSTPHADCRAKRASLGQYFHRCKRAPRLSARRGGWEAPKPIRVPSSQRPARSLAAFSAATSSQFSGYGTTRTATHTRMMGRAAAAEAPNNGEDFQCRKLLVETRAPIDECGLGRAARRQNAGACANGAARRSLSALKPPARIGGYPLESWVHDAAVRFALTK